MKKILLVMFILLFTATSAYCGKFEDALKMAEQGDAEAQNNIGVMYENGQGVPQDYKQALHWYKMAAEQGHAGAQHNLGCVYAKGQGVTQDFIIAYVWSSLAAAQGMGINNREVIAKMLTTQQLYEAQDKAAKLQSQIGNPTKSKE